ncbi:MAG TPA: pilin, partial [Patescibacteria group bacterium]|nr:pilin [Patescibacteria group bacterium]
MAAFSSRGFNYFCKTLLLGVFFFILTTSLFVPFTNAQTDLHIGSQCTSNSQCRSGDCEESSVEDSKGNNKWFCDCDDVKDCSDEYGAPPDKGTWKCVDDGPDDLDYCQSTKGYTEPPRPDADPSLWDAIFDQNATAALTRAKAEGLKPNLAIRIPDLTFSNTINSRTNEEGKTVLDIPYLAQYLAAVYKFGVAIVSIVAVAMIIQQGFAIIVSGGGEGKTEAYHRIGQIIIGLFILWSSYTILYLINPNLVTIRPLPVQYVDRVPLIDVITEPVVEVPVTVGPGNVPNYKQFAAAWGSLKYGEDASCTTIAQAGCGP